MYEGAWTSPHLAPQGRRLDLEALPAPSPRHEDSAVWPRATTAKRVSPSRPARPSDLT